MPGKTACKQIQTIQTDLIESRVRIRWIGNRHRQSHHAQRTFWWRKKRRRRSKKKQHSITKPFGIWIMFWFGQKWPCRATGSQVKLGAGARGIVALPTISRWGPISPVRHSQTNDELKQNKSIWSTRRVRPRHQLERFIGFLYGTAVCGGRRWWSVVQGCRCCV